MFHFSRKCSKRFAVLFIFCFFFLVFARGNDALFVENEWFRGHQVDSDDLVFKALIHSHFSNSMPTVGLLRLHEKSLFGAFTKLTDYQEWLGITPPAASQMEITYYYTSQLGIQPIIVYPAYWLSFLVTKSDDIKALYRGARGAVVIVVALNALVMTTLALWVAREFSTLTAAFFTLTLPTFAPWLVVFGHSVYWMMWSWFVPFLIVLWGWRQITFGRKHVSTAGLYGALFLSFMIKMAMGYEFMSTIAIAASAPIIYYGIRDKWKKSRMLFHIVMTGIVSVISFAVIVLVHAYSLMMLRAYSFAQAIATIHGAFAKRFWGNLVDIETIDEMYHKSLSVDIFELLKKYFGGVHQPTEIFIILLTGSVVLWYFLSLPKYGDAKHAVQNLYALIIVTLYSILAPFSHFVLMKGHSYIHTHINYVLWNVPFNIFCLLVIIYCFTSRLALTSLTLQFGHKEYVFK